jgi:uncharacterized protein with HEPN domain
MLRDFRLYLDDILESIHPIHNHMETLDSVEVVSTTRETMK